VNEEFYGRGLSWPLRLGAPGADGARQLGVSVGVEKIEESIRIILSTQYGERLMRPRFGSNLTSLVFAPNTSSTANLARYYVTEGLARWEPRIEVLDVSVTNDNAGSQLLIDITYRLRATREERSLAFSLPLEPAP